MHLRTLLFLLCITLFSCTQKPTHEELMAKYIKLNQQGKYSEAAKVAEKALSVVMSQPNPDYAKVTTTQGFIGMAYERAGEYSKAEAAYKKELETMEKLAGTTHFALILPVNALANICKKQGKLLEAKDYENREKQLRKLRNLTKP